MTWERRVVGAAMQRGERSWTDSLTSSRTSSGQPRVTRSSLTPSAASTRAFELGDVIWGAVLCFLTSFARLVTLHAAQYWHMVRAVLTARVVVPASCSTFLPSSTNAG